MNKPHTGNLAVMTVRGVFWSYIARYIGKPVAFLSMLVLVRLLSKEEFGIASYAASTIAFLLPLGDFGIGSSIIFHARDEETAESGFWAGLSIASLLAVLLWIFAPAIALYFQDQRAIAVIRMLAVLFPLSALANIHESLLEKELAFSALVPPSLARSMGKAGFSIAFAANGFGPMSLIWGQLAGEVCSVVVYWLVLRWRPRFRFSFQKLRMLLRFGRKITAINLFVTFMQNIDYLMVGRFLGPSLLGIYTIAFRIPDLLIVQFASILSKVQFPMYVKIQAEPQISKTAFLQSLRHLSLITVPLSLGLCAIAGPFVLTLFPPQWHGMIPVLQALCINALVLSMQRPAGSVLKANGKLNLMLILNIARFAMLFAGLCWAILIQRSIVAVGIAHIAASSVSLITHLEAVHRALNIPRQAIVQSMIPAAICGAIMTVFTVIAANSSFSLIPPYQLAITLLVAAFVYLICSWKFQMESIHNLQSALRLAIHRKSN